MGEKRDEIREKRGGETVHGADVAFMNCLDRQRKKLLGKRN